MSKILSVIFNKNCVISFDHLPDSKIDQIVAADSEKTLRFFKITEMTKETDKAEEIGSRSFILVKGTLENAIEKLDGCEIRFATEEESKNARNSACYC